MKKILLASIIVLSPLTSLYSISYVDSDIINRKPISATNMDVDPFTEIDHWVDQAKVKYGERNALVGVLATADAQAIPTSRAMVTKSISSQGIDFYGNLNSRKFQDIKQNPKASFTIYWPELQREIIISGNCIPISKEESDKAFAKRSKESQATSWASKQNEPLDSYEALTQKQKGILKAYEGKSIPAPESWGGYRLEPTFIEFWQAGPHNLHSRVVYIKKEGAWSKVMLQP